MLIDNHIVTAAPTEDEIGMMRDIILAFIIPNTPKSEEEHEAVAKAVEYQIAHEKTIAAQCGVEALPQGTTGFTIGEFSMSFSDGSVYGVLTKKTICPHAYSVLINAGLLYKGMLGGLY